MKKALNFKSALQPLFWVYAVMCRFFNSFNLRELPTSEYTGLAVGGAIAMIIAGLIICLGAYFDLMNP